MSAENPAYQPLNQSLAKSPVRLRSPVPSARHPRLSSSEPSVLWGGTHSPPRPSCVASGRLSGSLSLRPHLQNGGTVLPFKGHQSAKHFTDPPSVVAADTPSSGLRSVSTLSPKGPWEARRPLPPASSAPEAPTTTRGFRRCQPVWLRP